MTTIPAPDYPALRWSRIEPRLAARPPTRHVAGRHNPPAPRTHTTPLLPGLNTLLHLHKRHVPTATTTRDQTPRGQASY